MSKMVRLTETDLVRLVKKVIEEQTSTKMRTCVLGESGTLVKTKMNGKSVFGLSKTKSDEDAFCYVPDSNTITRTTTPQA